MVNYILNEEFNDNYNNWQAGKTIFNRTEIDSSLVGVVFRSMAH